MLSFDRLSILIRVPKICFSIFYFILVLLMLVWERLSRFSFDCLPILIPASKLTRFIVIFVFFVRFSSYLEVVVATISLTFALSILIRVLQIRFSIFNIFQIISLP